MVGIHIWHCCYYYRPQFLVENVCRWGYYKVVKYDVDACVGFFPEKHGFMQPLLKIHVCSEHTFQIHKVKMKKERKLAFKKKDNVCGKITISMLASA